jgi:hypothetical protein
MTRFAATPAKTATPFGVGREITMEELPEAYLYMATRFLPEFDRQLTIMGAAHAVFKLNAIWPFRTGRSVRSWELGAGMIPDANNPPGPRPAFTVEEAERRLSGLQPGQTAYIANQARMPSASTSYVQGLWSGRFSPQLSGGAEKPLAQHLKSVAKIIAQTAERRAMEAA